MKDGVGLNIYTHMIHVIISSSCVEDVIPALVASFPRIIPTNEGAAVAINEAAIGANKGARYPPSFCLFPVLLFQ